MSCPRSISRRLAVAALTTLLAAHARAAAPEPGGPTRRLDPSAAIRCGTDDRGRQVRLQCAAPGLEPGVCLVASACLEGRDAKTDVCTWLERTGDCTWFDNGAEGEAGWDELVAGKRLVPAIADAAPGWWRDEAGRVFQVAFDLNRRMWLGVRWLGTFGEGRASELGGLGLDMGFRVDVLHDDLATRTRFRFLESDLTLAPFTMRGRLLMIDSSNDGDEPFLRLTTFVGEPARHDVYLTAGWWGELLAIEHAPRGSRDDTLLRFAGFGMTWDLWHDPTMESFVRLRGGLGVDELLRDGEDARVAVTPLVALEADVTFDRAGFHRLAFGSSYEVSYFDPAGEATLASHQRFRGELAYELVTIAINDQPVTLRLAAAGGWRDDLADEALHGWELAVTAGLRVSLWAPEPDEHARRRAEARHEGRAP